MQTEEQDCRLIVESHAVEGLRGAFLWTITGRDPFDVQREVFRLVRAADGAFFKPIIELTEGHRAGWFMASGYTSERKTENDHHQGH